MSDKKVPKRAPLAFLLHSLFGLKLSLILAFICFTGAIATIAHEIEWLYKPYIRASAAVSPSDINWGQMWHNAKQHYPDAILEGIVPYERDDAAYFAKSIRAIDENGEPFVIYVDPGTAQVTGHEYGRSFQDAMRALHYHLFTGQRIVMIVLASLGFLLFGSVVTGLLIYKGFWKGFFRKPRFSRPAKVWVSDLHRLMGLWSMWLALLIAVTCMWYTIEYSGMNFLSKPPEIRYTKPLDSVSANDINAWVNNAHAAFPTLEITGISLPYNEKMPITIQGNADAVLVRERANAVFIHPDSGNAIAIRNMTEVTLGERLQHTVDPLHFGTFGGLTLKLVYFFAGLLLTGLALSGAFIYIKRLRVELGPLLQLGVLNYLEKMKWPSLIIVVFVPIISFLFW